MKKVLPAKPDTPINDIIRAAIEATDSRDADIIADEAYMLTPDENVHGYYHKLLRDRASSYLSANKGSLARAAGGLDNDEDDTDDTDDEVEEVQVKKKVTHHTKKVKISKTRPISPRVARRRKWWIDMQKTRIIGVGGKPVDFAFAGPADWRASGEAKTVTRDGFNKSIADDFFMADLLEKHGLSASGDLPIKLQEQWRAQLAKPA